MKMLDVSIPITIKTRDSGLVFVTSPLIKGLLVSERTEEEALESARRAVLDLGQAVCL